MQKIKRFHKCILNGFMLLTLVFSNLTNAQSLEIVQLTALFKNQEKTFGKYIQVKNLSVLKVPLRSEGLYYIEPNKQILWQQLFPFSQDTLISQGKIKQLLEGTEQNISDAQINQSQPITKLIMSLFSGNWLQLEEQFQFTVNGTLNEWQLFLLPTQTQTFGVFSTITINGRKNDITEIELSEKNGDKTHITLCKAEESKTLPASIARVLIHE